MFSCPTLVLFKSPNQKPFSFLSWEGDLSAFVRRTDWLPVFVIFGLTIWSVLAIYSTNSLNVPDFFAQEFPRKQLVFVGIGWVAYWAISVVEPALLERYAWWIYFFGIALLLPLAACALLHMDVRPFIEARFGARRWIFLPGFSVQPSELVKTTTLILVSCMVGRGIVLERLFKPERLVANVVLAILKLRVWRVFAAPLRPFVPLVIRMGWVVALPFGLIFLQPDLGSALIYIPMAFALLLIAGIPLRFFAILALAALPGTALLTVDMAAYGRALQQYQDFPPPNAKSDPAEGIRATYQGLLPIRNYHRERIMTLVAPRLIDPSGRGKEWQPRQARMAVARGGFSGQGFQNGTLVRLDWLPSAAAHNDFLFSCIAEESGFIGGCSIVGLLGLLVTLALRTAARARNKFGACIAVGVAVFAAVHVFVNIGMNIGLMPVTGVSLPFLSYGGSFILSCFLLFGMAQSVHRNSQPLVVEEKDATELKASSQLSARAPV
ncbi:MAG: FtsW/RodA/SpoVE family cell cycle protein [Puniceicoccales bacterium]|jgi:rod shape determining protein RodA|nr:FtsW/RodA/SpoVE family cell cycle protein [Puniceicoccales bacterium]